MELGYCVVFDHHEQGWDGLTVTVTSITLERAVSLVETISGYPATHERYTQEVFDLTRLYHQKALGEASEAELLELERYSPESIEAINSSSSVDFSVQAYRPLGTRTWINRKWDFITSRLAEHLHELSAERLARKKRDL